MKKNAIILFFALTVGSAVVLTTGCSKDDTTAPVVTLNGDASVTLSLNSAAYTDPGATANDEEDGVVTATSDASSTNPNVNQIGTYTITYTATDAAGNVGTAVRTVRVKNDAEDFAGTYDVVDVTIPSDPYPFVNVITVDPAVNNRVHFDLFADYDNNTNIYATKIGNGSLEIPAQTATDIGAGVLPCQVADHTFTSTSYTGTPASFVLMYNDNNICAGQTVLITTNWTKQ